MSSTARTLDQIPVVADSSAITAAAAWEAIASRDRRLDGQFVYGVRTTGVFCRPGCGARLPRRENVEVFATPQAAVRGRLSRLPRAATRISRDRRSATSIARGRCSTRVSIHRRRWPCLPGTWASARRICSAPSAPHSAFRRNSTSSSGGRADSRRRSAEPPRSPMRSTTRDTARRAGLRQERTRTSAWRRVPIGTAAGASTSATSSVDTEFGMLLVASTPRGVCAVALGDSADALESNLAKEFPEAHRRQVTRGGTTDDDRFLGWIDAILAHLNGRQARLSVPTDVAATAFQRRVWRELQRIPHGETRTYSDIAKAIGRPSAVRAVATACATNPVALVVPCHRVVPVSNGPGRLPVGRGKKKAAPEPGGGDMRATKTSAALSASRDRDYGTRSGI